MTRDARSDAVIAAFFEQPQPPLPDPAFDWVRGEIHRTRQRRIAVRIAADAVRSWSALTAIAAVLAVAIAAVWLGSVPSNPNRGGAASPTPSVAAEASSSDTPAAPTRFTSALYGYTLTVPAGWRIRPVIQAWDGRTQPAFGGADVDAFTGPDRISAYGFAGPFVGDLSALVADRVAANVRDHSDSCPAGALGVNEPIDFSGQAGVLLGWNCGALIQQVVTLHAGTAYVFGFRDLAIKAARDPTDLAIFRSILDSVELPAALASPSPHP